MIENNEQRILMARTLSRLGHNSQKDKVGAPYFEHVERVALLGQTASEKIVGYLHDIVEDGHMTHDELFELGVFSDEELHAIRLLDKNEFPDDRVYFSQLKRNDSISDLARRVKISDLRDNMDVDRFFKAGKSLEPKDLDRISRYQSRYEFLLNKNHES